MDEQAAGVGPLLSKEEAVTYLGGAPITVRTIDALVRRRELAFLKIGRAVVFPRAALDEYIAAHTVKAEPNPWGLTDSALRSIRSNRAGRGRSASAGDYGRPERSGDDG